jgi:hypothetical protein
MTITIVQMVEKFPVINDYSSPGHSNKEFSSSKGTALWPEEELEDLVCDVTCAIFTAILRVLKLILVTRSEDPVNRFINPYPRLSH